MMKITFLGTGTSLGIPIINCPCEVCKSNDPKDKRLRCSLKIETENYCFIIDASTDLRQQSLNYGLEKLDGVFLTHSHADHILGLDETRLFSLLQRKPVELYGSAYTLDGVKKLFWYAFESHKDKRMLKPYFNLNKINSQFNKFNLSITPIFANHGEMPVTGFRFDNLSYLTDFKTINSKEASKVDGSDILILGALRYSQSISHLTIDEAVAFAKKLDVKKTFLTHFSHEVLHSKLDSQLPEKIHAAFDGLNLNL